MVHKFFYIPNSFFSAVSSTLRNVSAYSFWQRRPRLSFSTKQRTTEAIQTSSLTVNLLLPFTYLPSFVFVPLTETESAPPACGLHSKKCEHPSSHSTQMNLNSIHNAFQGGPSSTTISSPSPFLPFKLIIYTFAHTL